MGHPAARVTDMHVCPATGPSAHIGGPILPPCASSVLIANAAAARVADRAACACAVDMIVSGAATVLIEGRLAARQGDACVEGKIVTGELTVWIGGPTARLARASYLAVEEAPAPAPRPTAKDSARALTPGEIELASKVFGSSIDYSKVKIHNEEYLPFGWQPDDTAMTPNGEMYFNHAYFKEDFSVEDDSQKLWFIHEMTHVWQHQLGYAVRTQGLILHTVGPKNPYRYTIDPSKKLSNYGLEQQGDIIRDYFEMKHLGGNADGIAGYESVLKEFLRDPTNKALLPD